MISIVLVNYNGLKWLDKCLTSLRNQTYKNIEIIIVDNASLDESVKFIKNHFPNVKLIERTLNEGFASGNNIGINEAKGEYIMLLNIDTWLENDFIERLYKSYRENKCDVTGPVETNYFSIKKRSYISLIDFLGHPIHVSKSQDKKDFYLSGVCLFFKKDFYIETKGMDNNFFMYFEETDWFWRLQLLDKVIYRESSLYLPHAGATESFNSIKYERFLWRNKNQLQMLLKNYQWYNLLWIIPIYLMQNMFEVVTFLIVGKPKISLSYLQGIVFNITNWSKIKEQRRWVQKHRKKSDFSVFKDMYIGSGKFYHFLEFIKTRIKNGNI